MTIQIEMPQLSSEGEAATLATWLVSVGDHVGKGDVIAELETDKATVELESPASGTIEALSVAAGSDGILPGVVLGTIDADDAEGRVESAPADLADTQDAPGPQRQQAAPPAPPAPEAPAESDTSDTSDTSDKSDTLLHSTPLARRAAANHHVDLAAIEGSGPGGRVLEADVLRSSDVGAETHDTKSGIGEPIVVGDKSVAVPMSVSRGSISGSPSQASLQLGIRCSMDVLLEASARLERESAGQSGETKITLDDFVLRAVALTLRDVPEANVGWVGDAIEVFDRVDLSIAVTTPNGSWAPVLRDADRMGLSTLSADRAALVAQAQAGELRPDQVEGGTFHVSSLGVRGIETWIPIVPAPLACVLGVGASEDRPVVRDGIVAVGHEARFVLVADPRAVEARFAAQFLAALRARLEDPLSMML